MQFNSKVAAAVLGFASLALSAPQSTPAPNLGPSGVYTDPPPESLHLGWGSLATPTPTPSGVHNNVPAASTTLTINLHNKASVAVSLSYASQVGGPSPVGNPQPGGLAAGATSVFRAPPNWQGTIFVGRNFNPNSSVIETNNKNAAPDIDVSNVQGYSVPIVCGCNTGSFETGCNKPLFSLDSCADERPGPVCVNPDYDRPSGPATPFFAPCQHASFAYPLDNAAQYQCSSTNTINCCIGPECNPSVKQSPS